MENQSRTKKYHHANTNSVYRDMGILLRALYMCWCVVYFYVVHACECAGVCAYIHKYGNQKRMPGICFYHSLTYCLETGSPTKPEVPQFSKVTTQQIRKYMKDAREILIKTTLKYDFIQLAWLFVHVYKYW